MQNRFLHILVFLLIFPCFLTIFSCGSKNANDGTPSETEVEEESLPPSEDNLTDASADTEIAQDSVADFQQASELLVSEDVYFENNSYKIPDSAHDVLNRKAEFLIKYPEIRVIIEGHSDERGSDEYNMILGEKRAGSVKSFLLGYGINSSRLIAVSYGKDKPATSGTDKKSKELNRRVHFEIEDD